MGAGEVVLIAAGGLAIFCLCGLVLRNGGRLFWDIRLPGLSTSLEVEKPRIAQGRDESVAQRDGLHEPSSTPQASFVRKVLRELFGSLAAALRTVLVSSLLAAGALALKVTGLTSSGPTPKVFSTPAQRLRATEQRSAATPLAPKHPASVIRPQVVGELLVGTPATCEHGQWSGSAPLSLRVRWLRNGVPIRGAAYATVYRIRGADLGHSVSCSVTAQNSAGSATALSERVSPIHRPIETIAGSPSGANQPKKSEIASTTVGIEEPPPQANPSKLGPKPSNAPEEEEKK
jgi:hypothetical protein